MAPSIGALTRFSFISVVKYLSTGVSQPADANSPIQELSVAITSQGLPVAQAFCILSCNSLYEAVSTTTFTPVDLWKLERIGCIFFSRTPLLSVQSRIDNSLEGEIGVKTDPNAIMSKSTISRGVKKMTTDRLFK